ncbi:MAG: GntR family transcriptional regulator [Pirellulales bacterium]|nr:GntR family transcriptional regulator [Pirellulales bacterium]
MNEKAIEFELHATQQPKHERLRHYLMGELEAGRLKPGQAVPSEMQLAQMLEVSRTTVRQAMASMDRDGLIRRIQGKGTFVHDQAYSRLKRGLDVFALVVPETLAGYYPSLQSGFESVASESQNQVIVCSTKNSISRQAEIILQLLDKKVAGVAIVPTSWAPTPAYQIRQFQEQGIPVVFCHRRVEGISAPVLHFRFKQVGRMAGEAFASHGHRQAAFFVHRASDASANYEAGLRTAMRAHGGDLLERHIYRGSQSTPELFEQEDAMLEALERMLYSPKPPTCIMTSFDSVGEVVYLLLNRLGINVPEDVSLVSFGGTHRNSGMLRRITSVAVDESEIGRRAAGLLNEMRSGIRSIDNDEEILMPLVLSDGQTLGNVTQHRKILIDN